MVAPAAANPPSCAPKRVAEVEAADSEAEEEASAIVEEEEAIAVEEEASIVEAEVDSTADVVDHQEADIDHIDLFIKFKDCHHFNLSNHLIGGGCDRSPSPPIPAFELNL